jgi:hypothetical protein
MAFAYKLEEEIQFGKKQILPQTTEKQLKE